MGIELGDHDALADCPLCGGEAFATEIHTGTWGKDWRSHDIVMCKTCGCSVGALDRHRCYSGAGKTDKDTAREAWNRRPE